MCPHGYLSGSRNLDLSLLTLIIGEMMLFYVLDTFLWICARKSIFFYLLLAKLCFPHEKEDLCGRIVVSNQIRFLSNLYQPS
jgi:hypothetical protein